MNLVCFGNIVHWKLLVGNYPDLHINTNHTFQKQSALSQYHIVSDKGLVQLSIPTIKNTRKGWYKNVHISYAEPWQRNHWRTIENAYRKAPFFIYYDYKLKPLFETEVASLLDFNFNTLNTILNCLKLQPIIHTTGEPCNYRDVETKETQEYPQVFDDQTGFISGASILDLLFNLGPETVDYLRLPYKTPYY